MRLSGVVAAVAILGVLGEPVGELHAQVPRVTTPEGVNVGSATFGRQRVVLIAVKDARGAASGQVGLTPTQADSLAVELSAYYLDRGKAARTRTFTGIGGTLVLEWSPQVGGELAVTVLVDGRRARRVLTRDAMRTMQGGVLHAIGETKRAARPTGQR